jgi:transcriptional regulator with XRE-family HTH domain
VQLDGAAEAWQSDFGRRLRNLRHEQGLSQMALAHAVGLHPTYISGIERGERNVSLVNIHRLAIGLRVTPAVFFPEE